MKLIYIGDYFYRQSGTMMSPIYHETGERSDWGQVSCALRAGENVHIRQATQQEKTFYEQQLAILKEKCNNG